MKWYSHILTCVYFLFICATIISFFQQTSSDIPNYSEKTALIVSSLETASNPSLQEPEPPIHQLFAKQSQELAAQPTFTQPVKESAILNPIKEEPPPREERALITTIPEPPPPQNSAEPLAFDRTATPQLELIAQQTGLPPTPGKGIKNFYPVPKRAVLSHNGGYGDDATVGYGTNYSTLELFLASDYSKGSLYPLVDLRAHRFDNDTYAASLGVGARYIPAPNTFCEILGFNVFYDWRQGFLSQYNQLGVGLEVLGKRWDFRANGYFPVGAKTFKVTCVFDDYVGGYYIINKRKEITSYGFNAEVGWLAIASKDFFLYAAAGPYYLTRSSSCSCAEPIRGGSIRIRPQYKDYAALDIRFSHDSAFNTVWETTFIVSLPLYQITNQNEKPCGLTDRQIYQPIERLDVMSLGNMSCWSENY